MQKSDPQVGSHRRKSGHESGAPTMETSKFMKGALSVPLPQKDGCLSHNRRPSPVGHGTCHYPNMGLLGLHNCDTPIYKGMDKLKPWLVIISLQ